MKFPRHAKILRSHFDVAPFAAVFFVLVIFLLLGALLPTPGIPLQPPSAANLPGVGTPTVAMAVDAQGQLYFENQRVTERQLKTQLAAAARAAREPLTLVIHADKTVTYDRLAQLALLVRDLDTNRPAIGITNLLLATLPRAEAVARP
jgi:biopolymer transport protein ExbD